MLPSHRAISRAIGIVDDRLVEWRERLARWRRADGFPAGEIDGVNILLHIGKVRATIAGLDDLKTRHLGGDFSVLDAAARLEWSMGAGFTLSDELSTLSASLAALEGALVKVLADNGISETDARNGAANARVKLAANQFADTLTKIDATRALYE